MLFDKESGKTMNVNEKNIYLQAVKSFSVTKIGENMRPIEDVINFENQPPLVQKIIAEIKKEQGLTYAEAFSALECVYRFLKIESNFVNVGR